MELTLPADLTGREVDVVNHPAVVRLGANVVVLVIQAGYRRFLLTGADRRCEEHVVVPDYRRAPAQTWDGGLPHNVLRLAPRVWQRGIVGNGSCVRTSELGPLIIGRQRTRQCEQRQTDGQDRGTIHRVSSVFKRLTGWAEAGLHSRRPQASPT